MNYTHDQHAIIESFSQSKSEASHIYTYVSRFQLKQPNTRTYAFIVCGLEIRVSVSCFIVFYGVQFMAILINFFLIFIWHSVFGSINPFHKLKIGLNDVICVVSGGILYLYIYIIHTYMDLWTPLGAALHFIFNVEMKIIIIFN